MQVSPVICRMVGKLVRKGIVFMGIDRILPALVAGKPSQYFLCKFIPDNVDYNQQTIREIERNGVKFKVDISDHMQWLIYFGHNIENREALYELAKNKNTILDVGANVGETALNMAQIAGVKSIVYAIEANPVTFDSLEFNCYLNPELNIKRINIGLSDMLTTMQVNNRTERNKGADQLKSLNDQSTENGGAKVDVKTIDYLIETGELSNNIDLIKIDVEGMEFPVLKGAKKLLENNRPVLFLEFSESNFKDFGYSGSEVVEYLKSFEYELISAKTGIIIEQASQIEEHTDLIALKK